MWKIKVSETKSIRIAFTKRKNCPNVKLYGQLLPSIDKAKYLEMHLDSMLSNAQKKRVESQIIQNGNFNCHYTTN